MPGNSLLFDLCTHRTPAGPKGQVWGLGTPGAGLTRATPYAVHSHCGLDHLVSDVRTARLTCTGLKGRLWVSEHALAPMIGQGCTTNLTHSTHSRILKPCDVHTVRTACVSPVRAGLKGKPITLKGQIQLLSFCAFELCVGIFWPSMMSMRANYVPEELRATIINIFRIPLNAFVCVVLGNVSLLMCAVPGIRSLLDS